MTLSYVSGSYRVFRGGRWGLDSRSARVSVRACDSPGRCFSVLGVRLMRRCT